MPEFTNAGHRQRLRDRFLNNEEGSRSDEALLELLLTYAIPRADVRPLAKQLLAARGNLISVLETPIEDLCEINGIKVNSAALIKIVDCARRLGDISILAGAGKKVEKQLTLFEPAERKKQADDRNIKKPTRRSRSGVFGKALLKESVNMLPRLPDSDSLDDVRAFLRTNLHFSSELTRQRNASYIAGGMFTDGYADRELRTFAKIFPDTQELRDVCFYRFMRAEPLELEIVKDILLPNIGVGAVSRELIRKHLKGKFPISHSIADCCSAAVEALTSCGIARADVNSLFFSYSDISPASFAFVLHSEFPEPDTMEIQSQN